MPDHGRLFDSFSAMPSHTHGGSYFDAGFGEKQVISEAHGRLYDRFGVPRDSSAHGERFDEFAWEAMPALHGQQYDQNFAQEAALTGKHGTWFDVFRGGTEVRYMLDGADYEGTVIDCAPSHARVRARDGQTHEVGLTQFLAYRTPNEQQASPDLPASDADAPSAHSADAHGAFNGDRDHVPTSMPPVIERAPQGQYTEPRTGVPDGIMDTFTRLKSLTRGFDVEKAGDHPGVATEGKPTSCLNCGTKLEPRAEKIVRDGQHVTAHTATCPTCGLEHTGPAKTAREFSNLQDVYKAIRYDEVGDGSPVILHTKSGHADIEGTIELYLNGVYGIDTGDGVTMLATAEQLDLAKTVDSTETAAQGQPSNAKTVGHRANCPRGGSGPCGADVDGHCSVCNATVRDHEAVGKAFGAAGDSPSGGQTITIATDRSPGGHGQANNGPNVTVPHRDHKTSDHHSTQSEPGRCPHCGAILALNDEQTAQGQPGRKEKQGADGDFNVTAHKCVGTSIDVLKTLIAA